MKNPKKIMTVILPSIYLAIAADPAGRIKTGKVYHKILKLT